MSSNNSNILKFAKKYKIFKRLYFFYNIYIRNFKFYFKNSQFGEDEKILKFFKKNYKGNFIDLGCYHPTRHNNTFKMYKLGWRGINIDLNPLTIEMFNFARPKDINICSAISNKKSKVKLYFVGDLSTQNTIDTNHTNLLKGHFGIKKKDISIKKIKTDKLETILKKYKILKVDFMNIDIEGNELKVLKSINLKKYNIGLICVEIIDHNKFTKLRKKQLMIYFKKNGYTLKSRSVINYIFKKSKNF
ncbi:MAG: FkbM family methyltransferase [Pelagibacteraceae bacterium]